MTTFTVEQDDLDQEFDNLTPMQQLVLETLAARWRLGHKLWTFTMNNALPKALNELEELRLVEQLPGVVEKTRRACLTQKGKAMMLVSDYVPPIMACTWSCARPDCTAVCHAQHSTVHPGGHRCPALRYLHLMREQ